MRRAIVAIALLLLPLPAVAQNAMTPDQDLQQKLRQKKVVVQPRPAPDVVQRDANQAVDELAAEQRREETLRDLNRPPRRPDLSEPVVGGIQTRNLNKERAR